MKLEVDIYTETMAKVFADQGHWEKVADIYRHLLSEDPERLEFADALAEAESKSKEKNRRSSDQLIPLFREWIELLFKFEKLQKLKRLKQK